MPGNPISMKIKLYLLASNTSNAFSPFSTTSTSHCMDDNNKDNMRCTTKLSSTINIFRDDDVVDKMLLYLCLLVTPWRESSGMAIFSSFLIGYSDEILNGKVIVNVLPLFFSLSTSIDPSMASTNFLTIYNPMPLPS